MSRYRKNKMQKDDRMHGVIRSREIQERIRERMKLEDITFEEMINKYLTFPDEVDDSLQKQYTDVENMIVTVYGQPRLRTLMDIFWLFIHRCANGDYDIEKIIHNLKSEIQLHRYEKKK
jgi:seryl-tRNA synthetase